MSRINILLQYYEANPEALALQEARRKESLQCECGVFVMRKHIARHKASKHHLLYCETHKEELERKLLEERERKETHRKELAAAFREKEKDKNYTCEKCETKFVSKWNLGKHITDKRCERLGYEGGQ